MANDVNFLPVEEHYNALVSQLNPSALAVYQTMRHGRIETAFTGRYFILYRMGGGVARELDRVVVEDVCIDDTGLSSRLVCPRTGRELIVSYSPVQLWDHPMFLCLPLHSMIRFAAKEHEVGKGGSLAWPMLIKTRSRRHLRETGVTYCETGPEFAREFDQPSIA